MNDTALSVREALARQYYREPHLAHEVVTGACAWDTAIRSGDISDLAVEAADQATDLEEARDMGIPISSHAIDVKRAAETALCWLAGDAANREDIDDDSYAERPNVNAGRLV